MKGNGDPTMKRGRPETEPAEVPPALARPVAETRQEAEGLRAFHVHPAFTRPLEIGSDIGAGVVEADLPEWWLVKSEEWQETRLQEMWVALCEWGERRGVDEVLVDSFSCSGNDIMMRRGYHVPRRSLAAKVLSRSLCGPASLLSDPKLTRESLLPLIDIPVVQLQAFAGRRLRIEVYDASWDSMIAYSHAPGDLKGLPFAEV